MSDWFTTLTQSQTLVFWGAMTIMAVVPTALHYWHKNRQTELEIELKRDMVARGMSADEIERVLAARCKPVK